MIPLCFENTSATMNSIMCRADRGQVSRTVGSLIFFKDGGAMSSDSSYDSVYFLQTFLIDAHLSESIKREDIAGTPSIYQEIVDFYPIDINNYNNGVSIEKCWK